jgi:hypothetical protein
MAGNHSSGMECAEFAALLSAALDRALDGTKYAEFAAHRRACPACESLYSETSSGLELLRTLKMERVEPPARLLTAILSATSRAAQPVRRERQSWWRRFGSFPQLVPLLARVRQPRFAMSFAMVFFSLSLLLDVSGVSVYDLLELRPGTIQRALGTAEGRVLKYYDNLRFVYEIESRVRELKRAVPTEPPSPEPEQRPQPRPKDDRTSMPGQSRSHREPGESFLAAVRRAPGDGQLAYDRRSL